MPISPSELVCHSSDLTSKVWTSKHGILITTCDILTDMGTVMFEVGLGHMTDSSMVIGCAMVPDMMPLLTKGHLRG